MGIDISALNLLNSLVKQENKNLNSLIKKINKGL